MISMRCHDVASMSVRRHFEVMHLLGRKRHFDVMYLLERKNTVELFSAANEMNNADLKCIHFFL